MEGVVVGDSGGFLLYSGGHWFLLNSKVPKGQLPICIRNKHISNIIRVFCKVFLMLLLKDKTFPNQGARQLRC